MGFLRSGFGRFCFFVYFKAVYFLLSCRFCKGFNMFIHYSLDKVFGPAGSVTGIFLILVGVATIHLSFSGAILIGLGSFMAFTTTGTSVDIENFRIRFSNNLFGFIKVGKWRYVSPKMKLGISNAKMTYRVYSMSNRSIDVSNTDVRVYLFNEDGRKINAVCRYKKVETAQEELARLSDILGLEIRNEKEAFH
jgi:hypothetical protein